MKARFLVLGLALAFCLRASADTFPIIDVRYGYLIEAIESGNWFDLNGDSKIDIVVRSAYYEGNEITVYEYQPSGAKKVLSVGCGL